MTFAAAQNYIGSTTVEKGATLRLGSGKAGGSGDGSLLMSSSPLIKVINNGALYVNNARTGTSLSRISGTGSFTQAGAATTTLTGAITYTGPTTVSRGTLALTGGSLRSSGGVRLSKAGAVLDLRRAGDQTVKSLAGVKGSVLSLGTAAELTTLGAKSTAFAGTVKGGTWSSPAPARSPSSGANVNGGYTSAAAPSPSRRGPRSRSPGR